MNHVGVQDDWLDLQQPRARARRKDPPSSHEAAARVESTGKASLQRAFALAAVRARPGCTTMELAHHTAPRPSKIDETYRVLGRRLPELRDDGHLRNGGAHRKCEHLKRNVVTWYPM